MCAADTVLGFQRLYFFKDLLVLKIVPGRAPYRSTSVPGDKVTTDFPP